MRGTIGSGKGIVAVAGRQENGAGNAEAHRGAADAPSTPLRPLAPTWGLLCQSII